MTDIEGTLRLLLPSGQWAIAAPGREPVRILPGVVFMIEVAAGRWQMRARMEQRDGKWYAVGNRRRVELKEGLRAGFYDQRERYAKELP
jgi:hypothetical protein